MESVAVFDFDGTITRRDSLVAFLMTAVPSSRFFAKAVTLTPQVIAYRLRVRPGSRLKEDVLKRFFAGMPAECFAQLAQRFAEREVPRLVRPAALDRLRWHICEKHRVVITTASLEAYVRPWAVRNGIESVLGTRLEIDARGLLTGRIDGLNCYGAEKVARLQGLLGDGLSRSTVYAYGDSKGDRELLRLATYASYRPFRTRQLAGVSS